MTVEPAAEYEAFAISCCGTSDGSYGSCGSVVEWDAQVAEWEAEEQRQEEERQQEERAEAELLAGLLASCQNGYMQACDDLQWEAAWGSAEV